MSLHLPARFLRPVVSNRHGEATVQPRQIYIIPTRYGIGFALLLLLLWIGSINYANNLGFLLTFLLAGLGLVAMLHTWRNLVGLVCQAGRGEETFKGQQAQFPIRLINRRRDERPNLRLRLNRNPDQCCDLPTAGERILSLATPAERRGRLPVPRCIISTTYPLGLFYAWSYLQLDGEVVVYPAPGPRQPTTDYPSYQPNQLGDKGVGTDDFVGLRSYREGDSPKQIDWKAQAREQGLHTKQFGGDRADQLWLDWDQLPGLDTEARLSSLCRAVLDASERQQLFGLRLPGLVLKPARGEHQRQTALTALALFGEAP